MHLGAELNFLQCSMFIQHKSMNSTTPIAGNIFFKIYFSFLLLFVKKTNLVSKMRFKSYLFRAVILVFYRVEKMLFRHQIWQVCRKLVYLHHQFFSKFLEMFYYLFRRKIWAGAYELGIQSGFLYLNGKFTLAHWSMCSCHPKNILTCQKKLNKNFVRTSRRSISVRQVS